MSIVILYILQNNDNILILKEDFLVKHYLSHCITLILFRFLCFIPIPLLIAKNQLPCQNIVFSIEYLKNRLPMTKLWTERSAAEVIDIKRQIVHLMRDGGKDQTGIAFSEACKELKIPQTTAWQWKNADDDWREACDNARQGMIESMLDVAENKLLENVKSGDNTSIIFFMKTQGKARGYIEKTQVETTITHTIDIAEAARRISFAMRAAERQGIIIDNISDALPAPVAKVKKDKRPVGNGKAQHTNGKAQRGNDKK